jgi:hypothetical protein
LDRASIAKHATDRPDANWHRSDDQTATAWRAALLRLGRFGLDEEHGRNGHCRNRDQDGSQRECHRLVGGETSE